LSLYINIQKNPWVGVISVIYLEHDFINPLYLPKKRIKRDPLVFLELREIKVNFQTWNESNLYKKCFLKWRKKLWEENNLNESVTKAPGRVIKLNRSIYHEFYLFVFFFYTNFTHLRGGISESDRSWFVRNFTDLVYLYWQLSRPRTDKRTDIKVRGLKTITKTFETDCKVLIIATQRYSCM